MSINLDKVWDRYETALEARPAKGPWTPENTSALADSCADVPVLVRELERLPDLPGKVHGVKCMDPFTVQCDDCLRVWTAEDEPMIITAHRCTFNVKAALPGLRLCDDCWGKRGWIKDYFGWKERD